MELDRFFQLLEVELHDNQNIAKYHRFVNDQYLYNFRKAYLYQRYQFLIDSIDKRSATILDLGCGYGTTAILLTLLGHKVHGITLEYYFDEIEPRLAYWNQYGDCSNLTFKYADMFDYEGETEQFDYIVALDTLHHIEPLDKGLKILNDLLNPTGKIIVCEENGHNWIAYLKHIRERGFKRISSYYDERLKKTILFGNENTKSLKGWVKAFSKASFEFNQESLNYIRFYFPKIHNKKPYLYIVEKENRLWKKSFFLREFCFFGFNFTIQK